jgi:hypothetical protein
MSFRKPFCLTLALCFVVCGAVLPANVYGKTARTTGAAQSRQTVTGTVVSISGRTAGRTRQFTLHVNSYTSASDAERLNNALRSGGEDELMNVLSRLDAGRVAIGTGGGVPANAVIATPTAEGGTKLMVLFERNLGFAELRAGARRADYRFGYMEIFLDGRGRGEGTFIPAAKIKLQGDTWVVEDFGAFPARLMGVRSSGAVNTAR